MKWLSLAAILLALHTGPVITVIPDSGLPGTEFDVAGSGFVPGEKLKLRWDGAEFKGTLTVGSDGTFTYSAAVPDGATTGTHSIEANALGQGTSSAKTSFTVVSASATSTTVTSTTAAPTTTAATTPATTAAATAASDTDSSGLAETGEDAGSEAITEVPPTAGLGETSAAGVLDSAAIPGAGESTPSAPTTSRDDGEGIGGLILVLAIIGLGGGATSFLLWGRSESEDEDPEASPSPASEEVKILPPLSPADIEGREDNWVRHVMRLAPEEEITSVVATSAGLVGMGRTTGFDGRGETAIWNSGDGVEWERVTTLGTFGALLAIPMLNGVMSTVSHEYEGQMSTSCWFSEDGRSWEQMTADGDESLAGISFEGGVAGDEAVVVWGRDANGPGVWLSRDGVSWHQSALRGDFDLITHTDDGFLAFGRHLKRAPTVGHPLV